MQAERGRGVVALVQGGVHAMRFLCIARRTHSCTLLAGRLCDRIKCNHPCGTTVKSAWVKRLQFHSEPQCSHSARAAQGRQKRCRQQAGQHMLKRDEWPAAHSCSGYPFCLRISLSPRLSAMPCVLDLQRQRQRQAQDRAAAM